MPFGLEGPFLLAMGWSIDRMLEMAALVAGLEHASARVAAADADVRCCSGWWRSAGSPSFATAGGCAGPVAGGAAGGALRPRPPARRADRRHHAGDGGARRRAGSSSRTARRRALRSTSGARPMPSRSRRRPAKSCDSVACIGESAAGFSYAIVEDPAGFAEECGSVDLVVTRGMAPGWCRADGGHRRRRCSIGHGVQWLRWDAGCRAVRSPPGDRQSGPALAGRAADRLRP